MTNLGEPFKNKRSPRGPCSPLGRETPDSRLNQNLRHSAKNKLLDLGKKVVKDGTAVTKSEASAGRVAKKWEGGTKKESLRKKEMFENNKTIAVPPAGDHKHFKNKTVNEKEVGRLRLSFLSVKQKSGTRGIFYNWNGRNELEEDSLN